MRPAASRTASPDSIAPQLLETTDRPPVPRSYSAWISTFGTPLSPKPPTASDAPSATSATAAPAVATTLSIRGAPSLPRAPEADSQGTEYFSEVAHTLPPVGRGVKTRKSPRQIA